MLPALERLLSPEIGEAAVEAGLVAIVALVIAAAAIGLWRLGRALARRAPADADGPAAARNRDAKVPPPVDSPLARLRPPTTRPHLDVVSPAAATEPSKPGGSPVAAPIAEGPSSTDASDAIDLVFRDAWQGKLVPRAGRPRGRGGDAERPRASLATVEKPSAPVQPTQPTREPARTPPRSPSAAASVADLDGSFGDAWKAAFEASEASEPAVDAQPAAPASAGEVAAEASRPPAVERAKPTDPVGPVLEATDPAEHARLVDRLFARGRFDEAARLARDGLAAHPGTSALLVRLARAEAELGRLDAAIDAAREAHRLCPSRDTVTQLLRLLAAARRFTPEDGERLRRAVGKHPGTPALLHAAGVFEATHGNAWAAIGLLRTALRLESDPGIRSEIERELARL